MIDLGKIRRCFESDRVLYSAHAIREIRDEELGPISDAEVYELVFEGEIIEQYPGDKPYPSCLVYGITIVRRPLHIVCAYDAESDRAIIVTVYQPDPEMWEDFGRRKA